MTISIKPDPTGTFAVIQVNGVDKLTINADGSLVASSSPAQFDASKQLATMESASRMMGSYRGYRDLTANTTLTFFDIGFYIGISGTGISVTLPNMTGVPAGATFTFGAASPFTIIPTASTIYGPQSDASSSYVMSGFCSVVWRGTFWQVVMGGDRSLIAATGYQKQPGGLIVQWGTKTTTAVIGNNAVTFPIVFPNAALCVTLGFWLTATANFYMTGINSKTTSGFNIYNPQASSLSHDWMAIGY